MPLHLEWRPVGDVLVIQCQGRIIAGKEVLSLHNFVGDSLARYGDIVLELTGVDFIDSSGLGALVRLVQAARAKGKDLKLSGLTSYVRKTLEMTSLISQFETHASVEEAITAAYLGPRYSRGKDKPPLLCVYDSIDMCTFLREMLSSAGYNALTAGNVSDARVLLKATKAKFVVLSSRLQLCHGQSSRRLLEEIDPGVTIHVLDDDFASQDPGEAAAKLIQAIGGHSQKHAPAAEA